MAQAVERTLREEAKQRERIIADLKNQLDRADYLNRAVVATAGDAIVTIDSQGIIGSANPATARMFGYRLDRLIGSKVTMLIAEPDSPETDALVAPQMSQGSAQDIAHTQEMTALRADGTLLPVMVSVSEIVFNGERYSAWIVRDISILKDQAGRLERSNIELERFAYVASHDLQAPVRNIRGLVHLLVDDLEVDQFTGEQREYLRMLAENADRAREQVQGLHRLSQLQRAKIMTSPVDLGEICHETLVSLAEEFSDACVTMEDPLPVIEADPGQIRVLFSAILDNAVKYRRADVAPTITIQELPAREGENWLHFAISDNGIGIEPHLQDRVFRMFRRLHPDSDLRYSGTGIGLALAEKMVQSHSGQIWVESAGEDRGSAFHVEMPRSQSSAVRE